MPSTKEKRNETCSVKDNQRVMIEKVSPQIDGGEFPIKRVVGENVVVRANVFADGHEEIIARLLYRQENEKDWNEVLMKSLGNDLWIASFPIVAQTNYVYTIRGFVDHFSTWSHDLKKKVDAKQDVIVDLKIGAEILLKAAQRAPESQTATLQDWAEELNYPKKVSKAVELAFSESVAETMSGLLDPKDGYTFPRQLQVNVDRPLAGFSSWYEFFPRSWGAKPGKHGKFKDCERLLPEIARMGFNVVYFPPIHPIGVTHRKGKNNSTVCKKDDVGCPWAIGAKEGGHKAILSDLGTLDDLKHFIAKAKEYDIELAIDLAYQCSPDHPYVKEHPQWFKWRPDGTVQFAENPPKKYEDVLPINFETEDKENLWQELKSIVLYWAEQGVRIFRVDNPHTKPFKFWDWMISQVRQEYPDTLFLAEAFTRPNVMGRLAKGGFTQSYTYFTWRNTKQEFIDYMTELTQTELAEFLRPNFWPNTPDILPEHLQYGGRPAFIIRAILAATLSSNFGIYGPAFELCVDDALPNKEEYLNSEKYEIKQWPWDQKGHLKDILARLNKIRRENPGLQVTRNIRFLDVDNESLLCFYKAAGDYSNIILVVINLDPYHTQKGTLRMPLKKLGIDGSRPYLAHDLLSDDKYIWQGETSYLELNPQQAPAHIIRIHRHLRQEQDFDYFM